MNKLTTKQELVFKFILNCFHDEGYIPTIREIADNFYYKSTNAVRDHLAALERKGYIQRRSGAARGIEIAPDFLTPERGVPIVGRVAAGTPITALENLEGYLEIEALYTNGVHYALQVHGDSMIDAGIWDGDLAIIREQPEVSEGEIGVAIIDGEATVKRIRHHQGRIELIPENDLYQPVIIEPALVDFRIGGKVVGIHRRLQ